MDGGSSKAGARGRASGDCGERPRQTGAVALTRTAAEGFKAQGTSAVRPLPQGEGSVAKATHTEDHPRRRG